MAVAIGCCVVAAAAVVLLVLRRSMGRDERPDVDGYHQGMQVLARTSERSLEHPVAVPELEEAPTGNVRILSEEEFAALPAAVRRRASRTPGLDRRRRARTPGASTAAGRRSRRRRPATAASSDATRARASGDPTPPDALVRITTHDLQDAPPALTPCPVVEPAAEEAGTPDEPRPSERAPGSDRAPGDRSPDNRDADDRGPDNRDAASGEHPAEPAATLPLSTLHPASASEVVEALAAHSRTRQHVGREADPAGNHPAARSPAREGPPHHVAPRGRRRLADRVTYGQHHRRRTQRSAGRPARSRRSSGAARDGSHLRSTVATAAAGVLVIGVGAALLLNGSRPNRPHHRAVAPRTHTSAPAASLPTTTTTVPRLAVAAVSDEPSTFRVNVAAAPQTLVVTAGAPCWTMVRAGGPGGTVAYSGVIEAGQTVHLQITAPAWVRLGAPWNATVVVGDQQVALPASRTPLNLTFQHGSATGAAPTGDAAAHAGEDVRMS